jgi:GntR family transcriptional repressor for pyruvate dehydrogenase complex
VERRLIGSLAFVASVTEDAIEAIRDRIVSRRWGPGTRLPREADLADDLGVSRNSLREAVRALSVARVLEVRQGDGTYVTSLEPELLLAPTRLATDLLPPGAVLELFEVRRLLEPGAAAIAARRLVEALVEADAEFHDVLARASGNAVLRALLESLSTRTVRARLWHGVSDRNALETARAEHTRIYDAVLAGDSELARAAATLHIETNERWLREHFEA